MHGGEEFSAPTMIDDGVLDTLRALVPLAPLHNPANIVGIEVARRVWPDVPHVAVFDTAFHRTLPRHAYRYAVPAEWYERHGVRRYGFHGTSHAYVAAQAAVLLGLDRFDGIVAHLGNGASITAVRDGESVDTSMGLSPLEGLVMGSRSGDVDPTVVTHVAAATGRPIEDVFDDLNRASGLRGLCGASDMREITARAEAGDDVARLAIEVFAYRITKYVGAYLAVLGGRCDALVFTGGIGEHSAAGPVGGLRGPRRSRVSCSIPTATSAATSVCRPTHHPSPSSSSPPTKSWRSPARPSECWTPSECRRSGVRTPDTRMYAVRRRLLRSRPRPRTSVRFGCCRPHRPRHRTLRRR